MREAFIRREAPIEALDILLDSISSNTFKQYQSCLKEWFKFCNQHNYDCYTASTPIVLKYLSSIYNRGGKYGTMNSHKSALVMLLGDQVNDDLISRFLKGVYRRVPTIPRYNLTWDTSIVLNYLSTLGNESISIEMLSKKLITLLALVTAHRLQTLSIIKICNIEKTDTKICIKIPDIIKTSGLNRVQPILVLPFFLERPEICPAKSLITYLNRTKELRNNNNVDDLFISFKKPHSRVSSQTLSRWVKLVLEESGINTTIFNAYSTRHASTSAARRSGVNLQLIRKTAGWTGTSKVFGTFYNRPVIDDTLVEENFARSILSQAE
jgi:hypothetical protein